MTEPAAVVEADPPEAPAQASRPRRERLSDRAAWIVLAAVPAALVAAVFFVRIPQFWADGATYHSMARSLAEDGDLEYEARDVFRVRREFPSGPQGIFLKRASGGWAFDPAGGFPWLKHVPKERPRVYFAKAFLYPAVAAPFVLALGTRGLLVVNALALAVALFAAYAEVRRRASPAGALAVAAVLLLATVTPIYLTWLTPELFNLGLIAGGLWAWRAGRPLLSAALLGAAVYSKPYNLFLAIPLGVEPLLERGRGFGRGLLESARRGVVLALTAAALFSMNRAITGEFNYQGGERKTFYGYFPEEMTPEGRKVTFGNSGQWMTTDALGPLVEGRDEALASRRTGPLRAPGEIRASFLRNLWYFWIGRFGGVLAYYFPALMALALFALAGPRDRAGWLALAALAVSYVFYITMIPDNWYGGGGTVGNRYFLNLLPLVFLLAPRGREWLVAVPGLFAGLLFLFPVWRHPVQHSLRAGDHAIRGPFRLLPAELTMLNDLSVFTEPWRKKRPYGDTEGDPHKGWPADPKSYYLYFLDDGAYGQEAVGEELGFWLRGEDRAEVVLRALEPVRRMKIAVTGGPAGDEVTVGVGGAHARLTVRPGERGETVLATGPGFPYYDTFLHVLKLDSRRAGLDPDDPQRTLGSFVTIALEVDKRTGSNKQ